MSAEVAAFIAGFVAAEGCFTRSIIGDQERFAFAVGLGAVDTRLCEDLRDWFGVGRIQHFPRRKDHYDDEVAYSARSLRELVEVVVPFMDEWLPPSHKREQYLTWRADLLDYWEHRAKRRRPCTVEGCDRPQRARGLCRRHYYEEHGR